MRNQTECWLETVFGLYAAKSELRTKLVLRVYTPEQLEWVYLPANKTHYQRDDQKPTMPKLIRQSVASCPLSFLWDDINNSWLEIKLPASTINRTVPSTDSKGPSLHSCPLNTSHFQVTFIHLFHSKTYLCSCFPSIPKTDQSQGLFKIHSSGSTQNFSPH
jgi:hypothetical protein